MSRGHGPCLMPDCGSSDAAYRYDSGWIRCFSCGANYPDPDNPPKDSFRPVQEKVPMSKDFIRADYAALPARDISEDVAKKFHYGTGKVPDDHPNEKMRGKLVQVENYYEDGRLVGQKLRTKDKQFSVIGKVSESLFGRHCTPAGGKLLVVTEGAIDAMSYAEVRKNWPVVSIPGGVDGAKKAITANLKYLESYDKVVFAFDNDDPGRKGIDSVKGLLSPGKMHVAYLNGSYKDFNECLQAGDIKAILNAVYEAEEVRPDGLVSVDDVIADAMEPIKRGLPWFIDELTEITYGRRWGEIYGLGAATGGGKTDILTEQIAYDVTKLNQKVGILFLEQTPKETVKRLAGKIGSKRFHIPDGGWTQEEFEESANQLRGMVTLYDSFGATEWDNIKTAIRHMTLGQDTRIFYLDHLTALADTTDERQSLEKIMKELAGLAHELQIIITFVSHLTTPDGTPHEEGHQVSLRHFKGSRAIGFWSFLAIGLERNQVAEDPDERRTTTLRVLKDRFSGNAAGHTIKLKYNTETGRIAPTDDFSDESDESEEF